MQILRVQLKIIRVILLLTFESLHHFRRRQKSVSSNRFVPTMSSRIDTRNKVSDCFNKESWRRKSAACDKSEEADYKSRHRLNNYERYTVYNHEEEAYLESQIKSLLFHPDLRYTLLKGLYSLSCRCSSGIFFWSNIFIFKRVNGWSNSYLGLT